MPVPRRGAPVRSRQAAEWHRLHEADAYGAPWRRWGPYLAERAWGTVREDYSPDGSAWSYFPWEHAVSRAYRWNEDGMGGICDEDQVICLALSLWNGQDPILKERMYGLTNSQGNHGEDVKECWWYLDATPTSTWLQWRYHYPQARFPYEELKAENARRSRNQPEYELVDTGIFDADRFFAVTVTWAKAAPEDILWQIEVENAGPDAAPLDVLPTIWFRNRWSWDLGAVRPSLTLERGGQQNVAAQCVQATAGASWPPARGPTASSPKPCSATTTPTCKSFGGPGPAFPKDGISDYMVHDTGLGEPRPHRHQGGPALPLGAGAGRHSADPLAFRGGSRGPRHRFRPR